MSAGFATLVPAAGEVRLRVAAAGDIGVIGAARARAAASGWDAALAGLAPGFAGADLGFANLEFPLGAAGDVRPGRSSEFRHDPELLPALARAGVRVVSLANNHILDCGPAGLTRTLAACATAGLATVGAGRTLAEARRPAALEVRGRRVVVLGFAEGVEFAARDDRPGVAPLDRDLVREDLRRWRAEAATLIVSVHWGSMYVDFPPPRVLETAQVFEEEGADLVLGHHPHVLQGWRRRGPTLTVFSLGDAAFNPRAGDFEATVASERRRETAVFRATIAATPGLECLPLTLDDDGLPGPLAGDPAPRLARIAALAAGLDDAAARFASDSAPTLLRYELASLGHHLRRGRLDKALRLVAAFRPRHLPVLWQALRRGGRER